jgi:hypothetical protein
MLLLGHRVVLLINHAHLCKANAIAHHRVLLVTVYRLIAVQLERIAVVWLFYQSAANTDIRRVRINLEVLCKLVVDVALRHWEVVYLRQLCSTCLLNSTRKKVRLASLICVESL